MIEPSTIIENSLQLNPAQRLIVIEALIKSLDVPNPEIEIIWAEEAQKRLKAYDEGKLETVSLEELFK
jgi:hypothetical protein